MNGMHAEEFIRVATLQNIIEAQFIGSILEQLAIPHRIRSYHDTAYNGLFQAHMGWGAIYAPADHRQEILNILEDTRSGDRQPA